MNSETQLHSAVFQLTPTRTRCDLVVIANERTEKIASGLVIPFLAHLNTAQEQLAEGGYSIILEPDPRSIATWFTKATVERFVRFVSTPEVLERMNAIESEILQTEEAISALSNENSGMNIQVENHQSKPTEIVEGKFPFNNETDRAIVLYKPGAHQKESNGFNIRGDTSKVQLLKVLEIRQIALQKEQGMAFARAVAAGFDMDHMTHLISFAECFGATRMMEACLKFMELWKRKHETGQWTEIETVSVPKDFSSYNVSGMMLSSEMSKKKEVEEYLSGSFVESNGKSISSGNADEGAQHEYPQIEFQHPIYPQLPIHSPQGAPFFPNYPMPGMPYYQNFTGNSAFYQPSHPPVEESRFNSDYKRHMKRHSMDSKDSNVESEILEPSSSSTKSHVGAVQNISEYVKESSNQEQTKRSGHSRKKQPGMVVIRNINYITSKKHQTSGSGSQSSSDQEIDMEPDMMLSDSRDKKEKNSMKFSKANKTLVKSVDDVDIRHGGDADSGNWQAFQKCLLQCKEERTTVAKKDIFSVETNATVKRKQKTVGSDPILPPDRYSAAVSTDSMNDYVIDAGKVTRVYGKTTSNNDLGISRDRFLSNNGNKSRQRAIHVTEMQGPQRRYRTADSESILVYEQESSSSFWNSLPGSLLESEMKNSPNLGKNSLHLLKDDSFIVPSRTNLQDHTIAGNRTYVGNDYDFTSSLQRSRVVSSRSRSQPNYEPDDLIPDRQTEKESTMHDPTADCELVHSNDWRVLVRGKKGISSVAVNKGFDKLGKEKKGNGKDGIDKKKMDTRVKNVKLPSKLSPAAEAQKRAEKLRAFKTDLQKAKKEQEEEKIKHLQALKTERQKRIAARSISNSSQSRLQLHSKRNQESHNLTSTLQKENRIAQLKEAPAIPLRKVATRNSSMGSNKIGSTNKPSRLTTTNAVGKSISKSFDLEKENVHILISKIHESHASTKVEGIHAKLRVPGESEVKKITNHLAKAHLTTTREARVSATRVPGNTS